MQGTSSPVPRPSTPEGLHLKAWGRASAPRVAKPASGPTLKGLDHKARGRPSAPRVAMPPRPPNPERVASSNTFVDPTLSGLTPVGCRPTRGALRDPGLCDETPSG